MSAERCAHGVGVQLWCTECGKVPIADEPSEYSKGYAAAVADVVAFVRVAYPGYAQVSAKALWPRSGFIIGLLLSDLESGAHVDTAKKGVT